LTLASNFAGSAFRSRPLRIHYPGRQLALEVTGRWHSEFNSPLPIVAGDWWLAGCVCVHSVDRPTLYASREPGFAGMDLSKTPRDPAHFCAPDPAVSPWTSDDDLRGRGGVLLWDAGAFGDGLPQRLHDRFPDARARPPLELPLAGGAGRSVRV